jgi:hypothetical protein
MNLADMDCDYFEQLVTTLKADICRIIDAESEDGEENGKLAAALLAQLVAAFMSVQRPVFQHDVNLALEAAELPWRLVAVN